VIGEAILIMFSNSTMLQSPSAPRSNQSHHYPLVKLTTLQEHMLFVKQFGLIHY